jgi:hypothetical protein
MSHPNEISKKIELRKSINNGISGLFAHISSGIFYPLELLKIRMQGKYY